MPINNSKINKNEVLKLKILKKFMYLLVVALLAFSLTACGGKQSEDIDDDESISDTKKSSKNKDKSSSNKSNDDDDDDRDSDDNDNDDDDDDIYVVASKKWDSSKMHGLSAPKAKLNTAISSDESTMYGFEKMKESDAKDYIEHIKEQGFTYNAVILNDYWYNASNKDGFIISFVYEVETELGTIIATKGEVPDDDDDGTIGVIGGTDKEWDSTLMGGLPDPGVGVVSFWTVDGDTSYTLEILDDYESYVVKIKAQGFTVDSYETQIDDLYMYSADNANGDSVMFSASKDTTTVTFTNAPVY